VFDPLDLLADCRAFSAALCLRVPVVYPIAKAVGE
jgi:hypothetical protein